MRAIARGVQLMILLTLWGSVLADGVSSESYGGRSLLVYVPEHPAPLGTRALVIVLHGGLGNAQRIESAQSESALNMDMVAESKGFLVAYLNGTPGTRRLGADKLTWNAGGGCCGLSAENGVDDVSYIKGAVDYLIGRYGIDRRRVYGIGHSNGAMMTQRMLCETDVYAAGVPISGPLNLDATSCPRARGTRILAIHGGDDENVPVAGGRGSKGLSAVAYQSEEHSRQVFVASGASYQLQIVPADHRLDAIAAAINTAEHQSIAQKAAAFFGLSTP